MEVEVGKREEGNGATTVVAEANGLVVFGLVGRSEKEMSDGVVKLCLIGSREWWVCWVVNKIVRFKKIFVVHIQLGVKNEWFIVVSSFYSKCGSYLIIYVCVL